MSTSPITQMSPKTLAKIFVATKIAIAIVALIVVATGASSVQQIFSNWNVPHYAQIAENGYQNPNQAPFFPALPMLLKCLALLKIPTFAAGITLGVVGSALSSWALYRIAGSVAALAWLIFPTAIFANIGYSEALTCAAIFWSWERAKNNSWFSAALLAALATLLGPAGIFSLAGLIVLATYHGLAHNQDKIAIVIGRIFWLLIPIAITIAYPCYLHQSTGNWPNLRAMLTGQNTSADSALAALTHTFNAAHSSYWTETAGLEKQLLAFTFAAELVVIALGIFAAIICLVTRRIAETVFLASQIAVYLTGYWLMSTPRFALAWLPIFTIGAAIAQNPPQNRTLAGGLKILGRLWLIASALLMILWAWMYLKGYWAG